MRSDKKPLLAKTQYFLDEYLTSEEEEEEERKKIPPRPKRAPLNLKSLARPTVIIPPANNPYLAPPPPRRKRKSGPPPRLPMRVPWIQL